MENAPPVAPKLVTSAAFSYVINPRVTVQTSMGTVVVELYPDQAPVTVANMLAYTNAGFYTGTLFHRVIPGFMDQGGGYTAGAAGMVYKTPTYSAIPLESNNGLSNLRGTIAMARTAVADSATSQFFINQADNLFLNYSSSASPGYAVFGRVVSGLAVIDSIAVVPRSASDQPTTDITITSVQQTLAGSALAGAGSTISVSDLESGASWRYSLDSGSTWTPGTGTNFAVPAGNYAANAIQVSQTDAWGHVSLTTGKLTSALVTQTGLSTVTVNLSDNLSGNANLNTNAVVYTLAFSEAVTGLDAADFTVMNGSVSAVSGSGSTWSASVTPAAGVANGAISLMVKAGAVTSANGSYNLSAVNSSQLVDTVAPVAPLLVPGTAVRFVQAPQITLQTSLGAVLVELNPEKAPVTVATMLANANSGFYDNTLFHTVLPGFVVQAGAYSSALAYKAPTYSTIPLESNNTLTHQVGSVGMLRASSTLSDGAQFFVDLAANPSLNYASASAPGYAVFGQVIAGMSVINSMAQVPLGVNGVPQSPIMLSTMQQTQTGSAITRIGTFTLSALTSSTVWSYSLDAGANWVASTGSNLALPDGSYAANAIQVRQVDGAGNLSAVGKFSSALVVDSIAPTLTSAAPADNANSVLADANLTLTFNEAIKVGSGDLVLANTANATDTRTISVSDASQVSISGSTLTLNPSADLLGGAHYALTLGAGVVQDLAGNAYAGISSATGLDFTVQSSGAVAGQSVIDLGGYGKLIAPVQVDGGKWYYYWDRSGDGTSADVGSLNGGVDYTTRDVLDGIFFLDINGVAGGDGNTTDTYRYATINGVHLALPTAGGVTSPPYGSGGIGNYQPGTVVGSSTPGNGSNAVNATYNDLLAVWDAYNGTGTGQDTYGTPLGWQAGGPHWPGYWSATASPRGHAYVYLTNGAVLDLYDSNGTLSFYVALQVLNDTSSTPVITSAATVSFAENGTGVVYTATATDADVGTTLTYTLGGTDAARFNINSSSGAVTFKAAPDYEAPTDVGANNVYDITVTANDGVNISAAKAVTITVTNVNEAFGITGLAYDWKNHMLLQDVAVTVKGSGAPSEGANAPIQFKALSWDASGHASVEVWSHASTAVQNFGFNLNVSNASGMTFTASALPNTASGGGTDWLLTPNASGTTLSVAGITGVSAAAIASGDFKLGTITFETTTAKRADLQLVSGDVGSNTASAYGLSLARTSSSATGAFSISNLDPGSYEMTASRATTDIGNAITSADALSALKIAVGLNPNPDPDGTGPMSAPMVSPYQFMAADVVGTDGRVTSADALAILKMAVKLPTAPAKEWMFVEETRDFWNETTNQFTLNRNSTNWDHNVSTSLQAGTTTGTVNLVGVLKGDVNGSWAAPAGSVDLDTVDPTHFTALSSIFGMPVGQFGVV